MSRIAILIPYFGLFPSWFDLFVESVRANSTIDFHVFTDNELESSGNIRATTVSFAEYREYASRKLGLSLEFIESYKLCDLRVCMGRIHEDLLAGYDFYGYCDVDLVFGKIRDFYTEEILDRYDVFSTHAHRLSGHLTLFRNTDRNRNLYKKIENWKEALASPDMQLLDEVALYKVYTKSWLDLLDKKHRLKRRLSRHLCPLLNGFDGYYDAVNSRLRTWKSRRLYLTEQYTTPFFSRPWIHGEKAEDQPRTWFYQNGDVTNSQDSEERKFLYLHFMNFKNCRYSFNKSLTPWTEQDEIIHYSTEDIARGIRIDENGFHPLA